MLNEHLKMWGGVRVISWSEYREEDTWAQVLSPTLPKWKQSAPHCACVCSYCSTHSFLAFLWEKPLHDKLKLKQSTHNHYSTQAEVFWFQRIVSVKKDVRWCAPKQRITGLQTIAFPVLSAADRSCMWLHSHPSQRRRPEETQRKQLWNTGRS